MKNNWLTYLLFTIVGVLIGCLLMKGCSKPVKDVHYVKITDTIRIKADTVKIPDYQKVYLYRDTGSTRYVVLKVTDTLKYTRIDSIFGSPIVEARKYSDSLQVDQQDMVAKIGYDVYTADELYRLDFDISLINKRQYPPPTINKRLRNSLGISAGYMRGFYSSLDYTHNWWGVGLAWNISNKEPGAYIKTQFRFGK